MKRLLLALALIGTPVLAQDLDQRNLDQRSMRSHLPAQQVHVIDVQPRFVTQQQRQCQQVAVQRSGNNEAAGILGAIAGAAIGSQIGGGTGKDIATAVGGVVGYQVGKGDGTSDTVEYRTVCNMVPVTVQRGEIVTFMYKGRRFQHIVD